MLAKLAAVVTLAVLGLAAPSTEHVHKRALRVINNCNNDGDVALTFDDGPYNFEKDIVDVLDKNGAKGTFFYNGDNWACIYSEAMVSQVKYVYQHGHQIGSHTWDHDDLTTLQPANIGYQMWLTEQAIQRITGAYPAFFRPPFGNMNDNVKKVAASRGLSAVMWSFDSGDSTGASESQQEANFKGVAAKHPAPLLSLEHSTYDTTATVAQYAITQLKAAGYKNFVTVAECVGSSPYQNTTAPAKYDPSWTNLCFRSG
ncbi:hypothetical protein NP233_g478 [Leucocoprinus birnbaumii]|uniref:NodB homology domain-containing protein n=1 Tax=Leucocoprinus birnbaumii TaxID=56174 RepID=A0AAD5Z082_9AGAR|nr:hypothetical protein NP233_g478 [Leucocoprinus birnbaumii]